MTDKCPTCKTPLNFTAPLEINQTVVCSNCGLKLEVVWLYPLELASIVDFQPDPTQKEALDQQR